MFTLSLIRRLHLMTQNCMNTNVIILLQFVFVYNSVSYCVNICVCVSGWSLCSAGGGGAFPYGGSLPLTSHHHHGYKHHGYPGRHTPYPATYLPHRSNSSGTCCVSHTRVKTPSHIYTRVPSVCLSEGVQVLSDGWSTSSPRQASSSSLSSPAPLTLTCNAPSSPTSPHNSRFDTPISLSW